ncbi:MAG: ParA family protein [Desulfotignum sp.]
MGIVLTISGPKGGIGKSVVAVNLAAALALYEKKVLLVDCDPRGCATEWTGATLGKAGHDIASVLNGTIKTSEAVVQTTLAWLDVLPAGFDLFDTALGMSGDVSGQTRLRQVLHEDASARYAYVIIDAPSSWGILSVMALTAADWHIAPVCPGMMTGTDCLALLRLITHVRKTHRNGSKIGGFVFNRCHGAADSQAFLDRQSLSTQMADLVFATHIPSDPEIGTAAEHRTPLVLDNIKSPAGAAFLRFGKEIDQMFT